MSRVAASAEQILYGDFTVARKGTCAGRRAGLSGRYCFLDHLDHDHNQWSGIGRWISSGPYDDDLHPLELFAEAGMLHMQRQEPDFSERSLIDKLHQLSYDSEPGLLSACKGEIPKTDARYVRVVPAAISTREGSFYILKDDLDVICQLHHDRTGQLHDDKDAKWLYAKDTAADTLLLAETRRDLPGMYRYLAAIRSVALPQEEQDAFPS